jgi:DNA-binding NtrC family response regulator
MAARRTDLLDGKRILLVEDDSLIVETVRDMVEEVGGELAASAPTISEARRLVKSGATFDVALIDVNLADGEATPLLEGLQARGIPVVVYTGGVVPAALQERHPGLRVLRKPVIRARLIAELRAAAGRVATMTRSKDALAPSAEARS